MSGGSADDGAGLHQVAAGKVCVRAGHGLSLLTARPGRRRVRVPIGPDLGARVHGPVPQGDFLKRLGIEARATTLMAKTTPEVSEDISGALKRLTEGGRGGMGTLFKVVAISDPDLDVLAGFADDDLKAESR